MGAGDTFQAALLNWLRENDRLSISGLSGLESDALKALLRYAHAAAALNVQRVGCNPPTRAELARALDAWGA